jgi:hypothetical protein
VIHVDVESSRNRPRKYPVTRQPCKATKHNLDRPKMDTNNGARVTPTTVQQQAPRCKICRDLRVTADRRSCLTLDLAEVALSARSSCRSCCILMFAVKPYESRSKAKRNELHIGVFVRSLGVYGSILICCLLHRIPGPLGKDITTKIVALELSTSTGEWRSIYRIINTDKAVWSNKPSVPVPVDNQERRHFWRHWIR